MDKLKIYTKNNILDLVSPRSGETKLGERVQIYPYSEIPLSISGLERSTAKFVLLGIPEDIGVRANLGIGGAQSAWPVALKTLLNIQSNHFLSGEEILVLGHVQLSEPNDQSLESLRAKTAAIDTLVYPIIEKIIATNKIPVVIGGGHNNAFPIIWGTSLALKQAIDVVNIDAHADLRNTAEGRHSGNGFSNALEKGYLSGYRVFGLHENYANPALNDLSGNNIKCSYFEDLLQSEQSISEQWQTFIKGLTEHSGIEIDLDSIENVLSSASGPSGFALNDIRKILLTNTKKWRYLHICEGAVQLANGREDLSTGKTIAYLVSDFIKNYLKL